MKETTAERQQQIEEKEDAAQQKAFDQQNVGRSEAALARLRYSALP